MSTHSKDGTPTHRVVTTSVKYLLRLLCRIDDSQLDRVPAQGPLIIVLNHVNFLEAPIIYTHLHPRPITAFVKAEAQQNPVLGPLLFDLWGAIPIRRGEADTTAFRAALQALKKERIVAVAPEGSRSGHGRLQPGLPGFTLLALHTGALILPLACHGGERFWSNLRRLRRTDFHIVVGQPFYLDPHGNRVTRLMRQQMADEVMYQIAALLPSPYRGVYSDLSLATETYLRFPPGAISNLPQADR